MPSYHATGVTATLAVCDLQASLGKLVDKRQGPQQRADANRIEKVFAQGAKLPERPIGDSVIQFVGKHGDLPMYIVEAGDLARLNVSETAAVDPMLMEVDDCPNAAPFFSDDSPLTSLGATPSPTRPAFAAHEVTSPVRQPQLPLLAIPSGHMMEMLLKKKTRIDAQALALEIELSPKSFLPPRQCSNERGGSQTTDLKLEVFVNGHLVDVCSFNGKKSAAQIAEKKIRFSGMRVHRQFEKPWIYTASDSQMIDEMKDATTIWHDTAMKLAGEAGMRGANEWGDLPPSREYLNVLAGMNLPERLAHVRGIGIIDLVITAGKGRKYGPETAYITCPTRLDDPEYKKEPATLRQRTEDLDMDAASPYHIQAAVHAPAQLQTGPVTSPEVPLARSRTEAAIAAISPTAKRTFNLEESLRLDLSPAILRKMPVNSFENAHRKIHKAGRTLGQRLGDLKKMGAKNLTRELEALREEFGFSGRISPLKNMMIDPSLDDVENEEEVHVDGDVFSGEATIDPKGLMIAEANETIPVARKSRSKNITLAPNTSKKTESEVTDTATGAAVTRTPKRRTRASALAHSPAHVPVKIRTPRAHITSNKRRRGGDITNAKPANEKQEGHSQQKLLIDIPPPPPVFNAGGVGPTDPVTPSRGANRTSKKWDPSERTVSQALKQFEVPEGCQGSCIGYDEDPDVKRQTGKARNGIFGEESLVVGIRFVAL